MRTLRGLDQASAMRLPNFQPPSCSDHSASNRASLSWRDYLQSGRGRAQPAQDRNGIRRPVVRYAGLSGCDSGLPANAHQRLALGRLRPIFSTDNELAREWRHEHAP
jgi:hypothetical protein